MRISFTERFRRACRSAGPQDQAAILQLLLNLEATLARPHEHSGIGLRKLHPTGIWELRAGLSQRALFRLSGDEAAFVFLGAHDEVKRFLKTLS